MEVTRPANPFVAWLRRAQGRHSYWLTRFLILRLLGFVYFAAFVSLAVQVLPLIGSNGLLPAQDYLPRLGAHFGSYIDGFLTRILHARIQAAAAADLPRKILVGG